MQMVISTQALHDNSVVEMPFGFMPLCVEPNGGGGFNVTYTHAPVWESRRVRFFTVLKPRPHAPPTPLYQEGSCYIGCINNDILVFFRYEP